MQCSNHKFRNKNVNFIAKTNMATKIWLRKSYTAHIVIHNHFTLPNKGVSLNWLRIQVNQSQVWNSSRQASHVQQEDMFR